MDGVVDCPVGFLVVAPVNFTHLLSPKNGEFQVFGRVA